MGWSSKDLIIGGKFVALSLQNSDKILNSALGIDPKSGAGGGQGGKKQAGALCWWLGGGWLRAGGGREVEWFSALSPLVPHQLFEKVGGGDTGC